MSIASRTTSLQAYHSLLYRKAVHPELFGIEARRRIEQGEYEFESWVFRGGHALLFQCQGLCLSEIVTEQPHALPDRCQVAMLPCAGERDFEETVSDRIDYITSVQTETLPEHLYLATYKEMGEHAESVDGLIVQWTEPGEGLPSMSVIETQRFHDEINIQTYHLRGDCAMVLRTQSIFRPADETADQVVEAVA